MKVIFTLPKVIQVPGFQNPAPEQWPKAPLAYVEWFTRQAPVANKVHGIIRKNTLSLEHPRKYPKGCPNTT